MAQYIFSGSGGVAGSNGKSAYEIWLELGNEGTEEAFIASLKGPKGDTGAQGASGDKGDKGDKGEQGIQGPKGEPGTPGADGVDGISVVSIEHIMNAGVLESVIYTMSDGSTINATITESGE